MAEQGDRILNQPADIPKEPPAGTSPVSLSLCMIVKNEVENLPKCLESAASLVDEMVVMDTGSEDETVAIAQSFGAQVPFFEWVDDFSAARNAALQYVTGDWVLVLDADERVAEAAIPQIRAVIQTPDALVVNLVRQEIGAIQSPYSLVSRLFRRHPDLTFNRPYHAMIDDSVEALRQQEPHWKIVDLPQVSLLHYGYEPGAIASRNKLNKARFSMERFLAQNPGDPYACSKLGALYVQMERVTQGIELLEQGLRAKQVDPSVRYELCYHLGIAYSRMKHLEQAGQAYQQAIAQPILPQLKLGALINLGNLRQARADWQGAKVVYEEALAIDPNFAIAHTNLGIVLKAMGKFPEAIYHYQQAIALQPNYADAHQNLGVVLLKLGQVEAGLNAFRAAIALHSQHNPPEARRLQIGLESMGFTV
mgnify:CR=1 FL=1